MRNGHTSSLVGAMSFGALMVGARRGSCVVAPYVGVEEHAWELYMYHILGLEAASLKLYNSTNPAINFCQSPMGSRGPWACLCRMCPSLLRAQLEGCL